MGLNHILLGRIAFGGPEFNMAMDRMPVFGIVTLIQLMTYILIQQQAPPHGTQALKQKIDLLE